MPSSWDLRIGWTEFTPILHFQKSDLNNVFQSTPITWLMFADMRPDSVHQVGGMMLPFNVFIKRE